jgi:hypothetical protein
MGRLLQWASAKARPQGGLLSLLRARTGSPAIEFALLAPVMIVLLTASYDITQSLIAQCQVTRTAHQIVEIATQLSIKPDMSMSLTTIQAYQAQTAIYALIPGLKLSRDINKFSVTLSVVVFIPVPAGCLSDVNCSFIARTAWSNALPEGIRITRPCGAVTQVAADQPVTINSLPTAGMTTATSVVVADVSYVYQPIFTSFFTGAIVLRRTAFMPPRIGKPAEYVEYDPATAGSNPSVCPGFL